MQSGTLTLLLVDVAERKQLFAFKPSVARETIAFCRRVAEKLCERHRGELFSPLDEEGPMFSVFPYAYAAIEMASELHRSLLAQPWHPSRSVCKSAIVTGDVAYENDSLIGSPLLTLNGLLDVARPGQILIAEATHSIARERVSEEHGFLCLGLNHLEDGQRAQTVYQLLHPDLPYEFQPLVSTLTAASNLPLGNTPFIGRRREIEAIRAGFFHSKVVTLIGFDGVGKTRLATQVAQEMLEDHYHGACYVDLAGAESVAQIYQEIALALGVLPFQSESAEPVVIEKLRNSEILLVLDSADAAIQSTGRVIARIVDLCPRVQILNTSKRSLDLPYMYPYSVRPMMTPASGRRFSLDELSKIDSVALFVNRAALRNAKFELTADNADTVAAVCRKLDGIPLAIELAAAKLSRLELPQIAIGLDDRFKLLRRGGRSGQPALETVIQWIFDSLTDGQKKFLSRLFVFGGQFSIDAAVAVAAWAPIQEKDAPSLIDELVLLALITRGEQSGRIHLSVLDTMREFCRGVAIEAQEVSILMDRLAEWYSSAAETFAERINGPEQEEVAQEIDATYQSYILSLTWCLSEMREDRCPAILMMLHRYWLIRCRYSEGYHWSETVLNERTTLSPFLRGRIHCMAGIFGGLCGSFERAERHLKDAEAIGSKLNNLSLLLEAHQAGGENLLLVGRPSASAAKHRKALDIARSMADEREVADALSNLGNVLIDLGSHEEAQDLLEESLVIDDRLGRSNKIAWARLRVSRSCRLRGLNDEAVLGLEKALSAFIEAGDTRGLHATLQEYALLRIKTGAYHSAAALSGAEQAYRKAHQVSVPANRRAEMEKAVQFLRGALGTHFLYEFERGAQMRVADLREVLLLDPTVQA